MAARRATSRTKEAPAATPTTSASDRLLTIREAAQRLTLSRSTLWRLREELPHIQLTPTRVAIRERDLQDFIDRRASAR